MRENSGVVVSTNGIKGNAVDLSMGPTALSNKTYQFDKVFSPAADQLMIFDEVVAPIIDEVSITTPPNHSILTRDRFSMDSTAQSSHTVRPEPERPTP